MTVEYGIKIDSEPRPDGEIWYTIYKKSFGLNFSKKKVMTDMTTFRLPLSELKKIQIDADKQVINLNKQIKNKVKQEVNQ